jgi:hypothetical protein
MNPLDWVDGYKTYIGAGVLLAVGVWFQRQGQGDVAAALIGLALSFAGLSHKGDKIIAATKGTTKAVAKAGDKVEEGAADVVAAVEEVHKRSHHKKD